MPNKMLLICGLPGSGKTTFAKKVVNKLSEKGYSFTWYNADKVREEYNDWDFSPEGRIRAAERMRELVDKSPFEYNVVDMVAPTAQTRMILNPDHLVWMNTIREGRFEDTNQMFQQPRHDIRPTTVLSLWGNDADAEEVVKKIV